MKNIKKYNNYKIINIPEYFQKLVNKSLFKYNYIINKNLVINEKNKYIMELNKPIYIDIFILNYSKILIYSFYYNILKPKYNNKTKLIYIDINYYLIKIEINNLYENFKEINKYINLVIIHQSIQIIIN